MEKLMIDSVITWATQYKVDGFRFDLMGHHMKANMVKLRQRLNGLTVANSGVDGSKIYLYGEGWNFGDDVQNNKRGVQATQLNMAGTGIGTFSDRLRDAVRGGGPFDSGEDIQRQGFISGLSYDPNDFNQGTAEEQRERLLLYQDQIMVGLAGNLRDYTLVDRNGNTVTGKDVPYNGSPTGYAADPQETVTYIEAHDNETLFDVLQAKAPAETSVADRVRMQNMGTSIVSLAQGVPFFHAGQDLLRSKSGDRNSYNSGDWFNKVDWTGATNNWAVGLPPADGNQNNWSLYQPLLANPDIRPAQENILDATEHFQEMLRIRKSSLLFRLPSADEINQRVRFLNVGPDQEEGLIVMSIMDGMPNDATRPAQMRLQDIDPFYDQVIVIFNANDEAQTFVNDDPSETRFQLHPVQASSSDPVVRTASYDAETNTFTVPPRTTAVFVAGDNYRTMLPQVYTSQP
jgi:pullulanase